MLQQPNELPNVQQWHHGKLVGGVHDWAKSVIIIYLCWCWRWSRCWSWTGQEMHRVHLICIKHHCISASQPKCATALFWQINDTVIGYNCAMICTLWILIWCGPVTRSFWNIPQFDFWFSLYNTTVFVCKIVAKVNKSQHCIEQPNRRIMARSSIIIIESTKAQNAALNLKVKHKTDGESTPTLETWLHPSSLIHKLVTSKSVST